MYINNLSHMTKMATMPIYGKNPSNIFFSETNRLILMKLGDRILISLKKENGPRASSAPALGLHTIIFKHVYWYMQQTQVSVYRTIGPLVLFLHFEKQCFSEPMSNIIEWYCDTFHVILNKNFVKLMTQSLKQAPKMWLCSVT